jgi:putative addiction module antidote
MVRVIVQKIGHSLGIVLPQEVMDRLNTGEGKSLSLVEAADGGYHLVPSDPLFEKAMSNAEDIMARYGNTLRTLAK